MGIFLVVLGIILWFLVNTTLGLIVGLIGLVLLLAAATGNSRYW